MDNKEFVGWVNEVSSKIVDFLIISNNKILYKEYCKLRFGEDYENNILKWICLGNEYGGIKVEGTKYDLRIEENYSLKRESKEDEVIWLSRVRIFGYYEDEFRNKFFKYDVPEEYKQDVNWRVKDRDNIFFKYRGNVEVSHKYNSSGIDWLIRRYLSHDVEVGRIRICKLEGFGYVIVFYSDITIDEGFYSSVEGKEVSSGDSLVNVFGKKLIRKGFDMRGIKLLMKDWRNEFIVNKEKWILSDGEWIDNKKYRLGLRILGKVESFE